ncbi:MAG: imidazole glycerol phosphate synthase subunit HisH [Actinobacteria bacterium]|nr:imidazole glycerol phosphate synthase subunit HisH [Actinomycetota bacterium]MCL6095510.1 imidazole glycerol phosphate synthase subunit HisH [Actinomycetota bacterium]
MIAVVDYGIGNLRSAEKALQRTGAKAELVDDPEKVADAVGVVLPGVGDFGRCISALRSTGMDEAVRSIIAQGRPFLGICVGLQMLYEGSEEDPSVPGLGILDGVVRKLPSSVKIPQMQWNTLKKTLARDSILFEGLAEDTDIWVYFVHSYAPEVTTSTTAVCEYGRIMTAAAERGSVYGTQFHPEKSGGVGLAILSNFVRRCGE